MKRIYDFYRSPPAVGQTIVMLPVGDPADNDWAWFALDAGEPVPDDADPDTVSQYDGRHAREVGERVRDILSGYGDPGA